MKIVRLRLKLILIVALALAIGLAFSIPLLVINLKPATSVKLVVDVKYAYFGDQVFSENISGLWRNSSNSQEWEQQLMSYIMVLNITNNSNDVALVDELDVAAAPMITAENSNLQIQNAIVYDVRTIKFFPGWAQYWEPNESRLVALTGTVSIYPNMYQSLMSGSLYLYGRVVAHAFGSGTSDSEFDLKQVQVQEYGSEFLYNALISGNQMIQIQNGYDVSVQ